MEKKNNINIAEILKDCPKGMKLYSPLLGNVTLEEVDINITVPIKVIDSLNSYNCFTIIGLYYNRANAECLLFPSSEMRDWSKFFKRGDVVYIKEANYVTDYAIFESWKNDDYTEFNASIFYSNKSGFAERKVCTAKLYTKANDILKAKLITFIEQHYNGKYNPDTLRVEPECMFKPFDKVLVRNYDTDEWLPGFFYRLDKDWNYPYHIMNLHHLTDYAYLYCIPYEGNEHLLGTTDPYMEGGSK